LRKVDEFREMLECTGDVEGPVANYIGGVVTGRL
jgi:hypothetical protein